MSWRAAPSHDETSEGRAVTIIPMSADIRIPADRIEASRIHQYTEGLQPGQFRLKEVMILMTITCGILGAVRMIINNADKPAGTVVHSQP